MTVTDTPVWLNSPQRTSHRNSTIKKLHARVLAECGEDGINLGLPAEEASQPLAAPKHILANWVVAASAKAGNSGSRRTVAHWKPKVAKLRRVCEVSRSGFYAWLERKPF